MSKKSSTRKTKQIKEISRLRGNRRLDIIKCAGALSLLLVLTGSKTALEFNGVIEEGNMLLALALFATALLLAIFTSVAGNDFAKSGRAIRELRDQYGITDEDIKEYERR